MKMFDMSKDKAAVRKMTNKQLQDKYEQALRARVALEGMIRFLERQLQMRGVRK